MRRKTICLLLTAMLITGCARIETEETQSYEATEESSSLDSEDSVDDVEDSGIENEEISETVEELETDIESTAEISTIDETEEVKESSSESEETDATYVVLDFGREVDREIQVINEATLATVGSNVVDVFSAEFTAETVRQMIEAYEFPAYEWLSGEMITEEERAGIEANRNLEALSVGSEGDEDAWEVSYGILMRNAAVRSFPTDERITETEDNTSKSFDYFQESLLFMGEPVVILHTSLDGVYSFVQGINYNGWVKTEHIQECSKEIAQSFWECGEFVVMTENFYNSYSEVVKIEEEKVDESGENAEEESDVDADAEVDNTTLLRMGTVLPLVGETDEAYTAVICCERDEADGVFVLRDGELIYDTNLATYQGQNSADEKENTDDAETDEYTDLLWVRTVQILKSAASAGYLEYTTENLLMLADTMVGSDYSWGDENIGYDCSSTVGSIYRCFGFILPRNSKDMKYTGANVTLLDGMTAEEKRTYITSLEPGAILVLPGHAMLYIGYQVIDDTGEELPVLLHCVTGYATEGGEIIEPHACVKTSIDINTRGDQSYLELLSVCVTLK